MSILDTPTIRPLVQDNYIIGKFEGALLPELLFRAEAEQESWGENTGDTKIFTGNGLMPVTTAPTVPGNDARVIDYGREQWSVLQQEWDGSKDTRMPDANQAAVNLLVEDITTLGRNAGMTLNRLARNVMFNAALSGSTVCDGAQNSVTTLRVKRLNGLTRARRPDLAGGSAVRFDTVSSSNPLAIRIGTTLGTSVNVIGFAADFPGDEIGPGTVTLSAAVTVADRDPVVARSATVMRRSGGGNSVDSIAAGDLLALADVRAALSRLSNMTVPRHADGFYHVHLSSISQDQIFSDSEFKQMWQGVPEGIVYKEHALGKMLTGVFFENAQTPQLGTVNLGPANSATAGVTDGSAGDQYNPITREAFAGEMFSDGTATGVKIARVLLSGGGWLREYYVDQMAYLTDAGTNGTVKDMPPVISSDGVTMASAVAYVKLILRAPQDRKQQNVSSTWNYVGGNVCRTDAATGDGAYQKRGFCIEHADPT